MARKSEIDKQKRNAELIKAYKKTKSLEKVSKIFNINEYDVWQILKSADVYQDTKVTSHKKLSPKEEKLLAMLAKIGKTP